MRLALASMALGVSLAAPLVHSAIAPPPGSVQQLVRVDLYDADGGTYYSLTARAWDVDGGLAALPVLPASVYVLRVVDAGVVCASALLCRPYLDGGLDPTAAATPDCACAVDATCTGTYSDGGTGPAPLGVTLPTGSWSGAGCQAKPCVALFLDGGDGTWPASCPLR